MGDPARRQATGILLVEHDPDDEALPIRALRKAGLRSEIVVARDDL